MFMNFDVLVWVVVIHIILYLMFVFYTDENKINFILSNLLNKYISVFDFAVCLTKLTTLVNRYKYLLIDDSRFML